MEGIRSSRISVRVIAVSCWTFIVAITFFTSFNQAHAKADVYVSGSKTALTVRAKNASLEDIIVAVNSTLNVKISIARTIDLTITGTYSGSLRQVLLRILDGQNFMLNSSGDTISINLSTYADKGTIHRSATKTNPPQAPANAIDNSSTSREELNLSSVQGWTGAFSINPSQTAANKNSNPPIVDDERNPAGVQGWVGGLSTKAGQSE
jgi:hypothetical protein